MRCLRRKDGPRVCLKLHACPACGRPRCFTRYVDEGGNELDSTVGKCDHESSCAYHKTPAEFFREHPERKPGPDWRYQKVDWVALVESEKTAVICAGLMPRFLWLATGGKSMINERLLVLKGRKVVAFPDIADWLIRYLLMPSPEDAWRRNSEFLKAVEFISEDKQEEAGKLIQELGLVFLGAEKNPL